MAQSSAQLQHGQSAAAFIVHFGVQRAVQEAMQEAMQAAAQEALQEAAQRMVQRVVQGAVQAAVSRNIQPPQGADMARARNLASSGDKKAAFCTPHPPNPCKGQGPMAERQCPVAGCSTSGNESLLAPPNGVETKVGSSADRDLHPFRVPSHTRKYKTTLSLAALSPTRDSSSPIMFATSKNTPEKPLGKTKSCGLQQSSAAPVSSAAASTSPHLVAAGASASRLQHPALRRSFGRPAGHPPRHLTPPPPGFSSPTTTTAEAVARAQVIMAPIDAAFQTQSGA
ncbi:hypothetical protein ACCO45_004846 [Purpureocillium lilacinum]|uniref:Uncharacterized protein n=1 Tax=Purpureocillium lilacinum TaxID=33203 RepID=A0ACC4DW06_PURLI